jgi:hypothetical protein
MLGHADGSLREGPKGLFVLGKGRLNSQNSVLEVSSAVACTGGMLLSRHEDPRAEEEGMLNPLSLSREGLRALRRWPRHVNREDKGLLLRRRKVLSAWAIPTTSPVEMRTRTGILPDHVGVCLVNIHADVLPPDLTLRVGGSATLHPVEDALDVLQRCVALPLSGVGIFLTPSTSLELVVALATFPCSTPRLGSLNSL